MRLRGAHPYTVLYLITELVENHWKSINKPRQILIPPRPKKIPRKVPPVAPARVPAPAVDEDEDNAPVRQLLWWEKVAQAKQAPPVVLPLVILPLPAAPGYAVTAWFHELPAPVIATVRARFKKVWGVMGWAPVPAPGDVVVVRSVRGQVQQVRIVRILSVDGDRWVASFAWVRGGTRRGPSSKSSPSF